MNMHVKFVGLTMCTNLYTWACEIQDVMNWI